MTDTAIQIPEPASTWTPRPLLSRPTCVPVPPVAVCLDPDTLALVRAAKSRTPAGEPEKTYDEIVIDALEHVDLEHLRARFI